MHARSVRFNYRGFLPFLPALRVGRLTETDRSPSTVSRLGRRLRAKARADEAARRRRLAALRLSAERDQRLRDRGRADRRLDPLRDPAHPAPGRAATASPPTRSPTPIPTTRAPATTSASGSGSRSGSATADADAAEDPELIGERQPDHFMAQFFVKTCTGPGHPVDRKLRRGRRGRRLPGPRRARPLRRPRRLLARVRPRPDRRRRASTPPTRSPRIPGLREPKRYFTPDPADNRRSAKRLGELEPKLVLVGHGPPYRDTRKFVEFCAGLPG